MSQIVHIVLFQFKSDLDSKSVNDICQAMLALKDKCIHPTTQKTYITTAMGGKDNSPEGLSLQGGITHAFISHFDSEADRKYYLEEDPAHTEFKNSLDGKVQNVQVIDFTPGAF